MNKWISSIECSSGAHVEETSSNAARALFRDGVVALRGAFERELVVRLREHVKKFVFTPARNGNFPYRIAALGDRRDHYTVEIHRSFNTTEFYANPYVYAIAKSFMGSDFILSACGAAVAKPGAGSQRVHRDQPVLFGNRKLDYVMPPVSLTVSLPLIATDERVGGTEFMMGSHRDASLHRSGYVSVDTVPGDCLVWDSRCLHRGCPNNGDEVRPVMLLYYQRPWFFNFPNYTRDSEIKITDEALERVPGEYRHLFEWRGELFPPPEFGPDGSGCCECGSGMPYSACHGAP